MLTITITPRAVLLAALLILAGVLALYATDASGSDTPDAYIQGDTNCDGIIDAQDALNDLRYTAGLDTGPFPNCPAVGSEAAIPGPPGPQGEQGPPGPQGPSGITEFAHVHGDGTLQSGTATAAALDQFGAYQVTFGRDLSECAAVASQGYIDGGAFNTNARVRGVLVTSQKTDTVSVAFNDIDSGVIASTDFSLIVAC